MSTVARLPGLVAKSYKWGYKSIPIVVAHTRGLITLFITTHEPPSTPAAPRANLLSDPTDPKIPTAVHIDLAQLGLRV